jgi:hypothetical protein
MAPTQPPAPTTPPVTSGPFTVQLTGIPTQVNNHATIPITVTTSQPNAQVTLQVTYSGGLPAFQQSSTQTTNANGTTVIYLTVNEQSIGFAGFSRSITGNVTATANSQSGTTATSNQVSFKVVMNG